MNIALFASGSSGNCALVSDGDTHILLDAGISARRIRAGLSAQDVTADALTGVLVTHEHSDHVKGLAVLLRHDPVPVYALLIMFGLSINIVIVMFGLFVAGTMWLVKCRHEQNQREFDNVALLEDRLH